MANPNVANASTKNPAKNEDPRPRSLSPRHHVRSQRHKQLHQLRFDLLRRGQGQLQNFPFFSVENLSPWFAVSESSLLQQKLIAWNPVLNFELVGRTLLCLCVVMIPLGVCLLTIGWQANKDFKINYGEECKSSRNYLRLLRKSCIFCSGGHNPTCVKEVTFPQNIKTPVYLYYELDGFNQNHRELVKSMDYKQLYGNIFKEDEDLNLVAVPADSKSCGQYTKDPNGAYYFPCGAMANAMFNDDFVMKIDKGESVTLRKDGISHSILKHYKFRNPPEVTSKNYDYKRIFVNNFVKPKDWSREVWDTWWENGGLENERFINWMVPSAGPELRKLYGIIDSVPGCPPGFLCKGNYTVEIEYRFDVDGFLGTKAIIFSKTSFLGSRKSLMGTFAILIGFAELFIGLYMLNEFAIRKRNESRNSHDNNNTNQTGEEHGEERGHLPPGFRNHGLGAAAPPASKRKSHDKNPKVKGKAKPGAKGKPRRSQSMDTSRTRHVMFKMNDNDKDDVAVRTFYKRDKELQELLDSIGDSDEEFDETQDVSIGGSGSSSYTSSEEEVDIDS